MTVLQAHFWRWTDFFGDVAHWWDWPWRRFGWLNRMLVWWQLRVGDAHTIVELREWRIDKERQLRRRR